MPKIIRPAFHALTLVMLACACLMVAQTVNTVVEASLFHVPDGASSPPPEPSAVSTEPSTPLSADLLARSFGMSLTERIEVTTEVLENTPPTQLALKLLGTMPSSVPELSMASLYEDTTRRTRTVWVGSSIQGAEVLSIERTRVVLRNGERTEVLETHAPPATAAVAPPPPPPSAPTGVASGFGASIRQTGPEAYAIQRQDVENTLANMAQVAMQARVIPALNGGVSKGFKLFAIKPDSIYSRLGLKNGDVLQRVNGFMLDSPTSALEAFNHLRGSARIEIEIERDGQPVRKTYNVDS